MCNIDCIKMFKIINSYMRENCGKIWLFANEIFFHTYVEDYK